MMLDEADKTAFSVRSYF